MINVTETSGSITFTIRVIPRASRSEIVGELSGSLKVKVSAPPVDGAANEEIVRLLAKAFGVARSGVTIVSGEASKTKLVRVTGTTPERLQQLACG